MCASCGDGMKLHTVIFSKLLAWFIYAEGFLCWPYPQSWCCEVDLSLPAHHLPRTMAFFKTLSSFCGSLESKDSNMNKTGNKTDTARGAMSSS